VRESGAATQLYACWYATIKPRTGVLSPLRISVTTPTADVLAMPKLDDQISTLQQRLAQLKLRQQRLDARKRATQALRERKTDTRRRILVGGVVLAKVQQGALDPAQFRLWLDQSLTRADDRALFDLPALPGAQPPAEA
jgi:TolA-binding protein